MASVRFGMLAARCRYADCDNPSSPPLCSVTGNADRLGDAAALTTGHRPPASCGSSRITSAACARTMLPTSCNVYALSSSAIGTGWRRAQRRVAGEVVELERLLDVRRVELGKAAALPLRGARRPCAVHIEAQRRVGPDHLAHEPRAASMSDALVVRRSSA